MSVGFSKRLPGRAKREDAIDHDLARLGRALSARAEDVMNRSARLTEESGNSVDPNVEATFLDTARVSTQAVGHWIAGGSPQHARLVGGRAAASFARLAAQQTTLVHEVTKRVLRWRDAARVVLREEATRLGVSPEALSRAVTMLDRSFDVTLVRQGEAYEHERANMQRELTYQQSALVFQATHDALTGLPNRSLILDRITQALARYRRTGAPVAVLFVDLDDFKNINDGLGHGVGDQLLRAVAARISAIVRDTDSLGRFGGDEFVVIAEGTSLLGGPELIAERVLTLLREPFRLPTLDVERRLSITASIGIAMGERPSAEDLLRDADVAMYRAKRQGKDSFALFEPEMGAALKRRMTLEMDLRDAIDDEQFVLVYQPVFDLQTMRTTALEALLRWHHPTRGLVPPNDFIPLLEETGLIAAVGRLVLQQACVQGVAWHQAGHPIRVGVNVSGRQLDSSTWVDDVADTLATSGFDPAALVLEITETTLMRDIEATTRRLSAVKDLGVRIAIDDFGTGYSSLDHLRQFPIDLLKIDQSFVARMLYNPEGMTLIRTLIQLGKDLRIETLAEGIEDARQLEHLRSERCTKGQGNLYSRPIEADAVEGFLDHQGALVARGSMAAS